MSNLGNILINSIKCRFTLLIFLCLKRDKFKSRSFSVKELINLEKKKENVNSPKELNPKLPGV